MFINADLFTCGTATIIQTLGFWKIGSHLPIVQGCTFAAVTPMILIGKADGITTIYGAVIVVGLVTFLLAPFFSGLIRFFSPFVTGTIITIISISLLPVAVSVAIGLIPVAVPGFCNKFPEGARVIFESGITMGSLVVIILNALMNEIGQKPKAAEPVAQQQEGDLCVTTAH